MIPRSVKAWLFIYGLFFGSVIGGIFGILALRLDIAFYSLFALVAGSLLMLLLIQWRYEKTLEKWLPNLTGEIGLLKWVRKALGREKTK